MTRKHRRTRSSCLTEPRSRVHHTHRATDSIHFSPYQPTALACALTLALAVMQPTLAANHVDFNYNRSYATHGEKDATRLARDNRTYTFSSNTEGEYWENTSSAVVMPIAWPNQPTTLTLGNNTTVVVRTAPLASDPSNPDTWRSGLNLSPGGSEGDYTFNANGLQIFMQGQTASPSLTSDNSAPENYQVGIFSKAADGSGDPRHFTFHFDGITSFQYDGATSPTANDPYGLGNVTVAGLFLDNADARLSYDYQFDTFNIAEQGNAHIMKGVYLWPTRGSIKLHIGTADFSLHGGYRSEDALVVGISSFIGDSNENPLNAVLFDIDHLTLDVSSPMRALGIESRSSSKGDFGQSSITVASEGGAIGIYGTADSRTPNNTQFHFKDALTINTTLNSTRSTPLQAAGILIHAPDQINIGSRNFKVDVDGALNINLNTWSGIGIGAVAVSHPVNDWHFKEAVTVKFTDPALAADPDSAKQRAGVLMDTEDGPSTWTFEKGLTIENATQSVALYNNGSDQSKIIIKGLEIKTPSATNFALVEAYSSSIADRTEIDISGKVIADLVDHTLFLANTNAGIKVTAEQDSVLNGNAFTQSQGWLDLTLKANAQAQLHLSKQLDRDDLRDVDSTRNASGQIVPSYIDGTINVTLDGSSTWATVANKVSQVTLTELKSATATLDPTLSAALTDVNNSALTVLKTETLRGMAEGNGGVINLLINSQTNSSQYVDAGYVTGHLRLKVTDMATSANTGTPKKLLVLKGTALQEGDSAANVTLFNNRMYFNGHEGAASPFEYTFKLLKTTTLPEDSNANAPANRALQPVTLATLPGTNTPPEGAVATYWLLEPTRETCLVNPSDPRCTNDGGGGEEHPNPNPNPNPDPNPNPNPDPDPDPDPTDPEPTEPDNPGDPSTPPLTHEAWGGFGLSTLTYAMVTSDETLRERMGDVHTFMPIGKNALWAKASRADARLSATPTYRGRWSTGQGRFDADISHVKAGFDRHLGDTTLVGGWLGYSWADSNTEVTSPANLKAHAAEVALYALKRFDNAVYVDAVARVGHVDGKATALDEMGSTLRNFDTTYSGVSLEVGRRIALTERLSLSPEGRLRITRFGAASGRTDTGLAVRRAGFTSVIASAGLSLDWQPTGTPTTLYAHARWLRELNAKPTFTFNGTDRFEDDYRDNHFVYGLGAMGQAGEATTWHFTVNRMSGSVVKNHWAIQAGVRYAF